MKPTRRISKVWMFITLLILSFSTLRISDISLITGQELVIPMYQGQCQINMTMCSPSLIMTINYSLLSIWFILNILFTILAYYCMIWMKYWIYKESK
jgi:hypothetical protein